MMKKQFVAGAAVGAVAAVLAGAGGYYARASAETTAATAPAGAASPASFADIVQRVSPAVVSIEIEGKAKPGPVTFQGQPPVPLRRSFVPLSVDPANG